MNLFEANRGIQLYAARCEQHFPVLKHRISIVSDMQAKIKA